MNIFNKGKLVSALLLAPLVPLQAQAEESTENEFQTLFGDAEFVSIATGQAQPLSDAPAVATVITAEQIASMGAINLDQVLEAVPGLHVSVSSNRFSPIYSIRGIHTDINPQVLMLVNGVPITQLFGGDRGVRNTLPVNNIARVEVIRGPGSAVYGADAFSGVINVITKSSDEINGTELGVRLGSFQTREAWVMHGSQHGDIDLMVSVDWSKTDGDNKRVIDSDAQTVFDNLLPFPAVSLAPGPASTQAERADLRLELGYKNWNFSLWNWRQRNLGVGPGLALALDPGGKGESNNYLFDIHYQNSDSFNNWEFDTRFSYMDINNKSEQTLYPAGATLPLGDDGNIGFACSASPPPGGCLGLFTEGMIGNPEVYEQTSRLEGSAFYNGFTDHRLRIAAGISYSEVQGKETKNYGPGVITPVQPLQIIDGTLTSVTNTPYNFIPDKSRRNYFGSIQDEWRFATDWNLTYGLRYDNYSDFGSTVNPRVALVWHARQELTTKFLYGRAFRAPSFAEQFLVNNPIRLGNDDLKPETINTYEWALDYRPAYELHTGLNVFYYKINDLIQFDPVSDPTDPDFGSRRASNTGSQTGYGFEVEAQWLPIDSVRLNAHYAFQKSKDEETGKAVANAPRHQIWGELYWTFIANWEVGSQVSWIAGRERDPNDPRSNVDDYTLVNLVLSRRNIMKRLDLQLVAQNLLNKEAYEPSPAESTAPEGSLIPGDFPLSSRGIYLKAAYRFQ